MLSNFKNTLFLDIETSSGCADFSLLSDKMKKLWLKKAKNITQSNANSDAEVYFEKAGLYAEFGKIICIGLGFIYLNKDKELCLKVKTIAHDNEYELLNEFIRFINSSYKAKELSLVAHNGKEFDFPYLCRRMLVHSLEIPKPLQLQGKKPWEVVHQDTLELWKFGDRKSFTSLELLAEILGIEGAKTDLSGDQVNGVYYLEKNLPKIESYCMEDVIVLAQLFLRFNFMNLVKLENIIRL